MSINVHEALELEILKGFKVIAGKEGIWKEITNVAVWDYETCDLISENFRQGDFALSTLVAIKDDIGKLYECVKKMIEVGITCLAIKNIYFDEIPDNVIDLANKEHFPIMMFNTTFTEDVIVHVNKAISEKKAYENLEIKIDEILYSNLDEFSIKKIARNINMNFREKNIVAFCKKKKGKAGGTKSIFNNEMEEVFTKVIPYKDGYLIINTFEETDEKSAINTVLRRLNWWGLTEKEYFIGVSNLHKDLINLNYSIQESLYACKNSRIYKKGISFFNEIGINKIIFPLLDNPWVLKYYSEMLKPLITYDKNNETELLKTAIKYIENNGEIKSTAEELFQHGNTVRYRIDKIQKIFSENCNSMHFYEELAVAIRIYTLLNNPL